MSNLSVRLHCKLGDVLIEDVHKLERPENIKGVRSEFKHESHFLPLFTPENHLFHSNDKCKLSLINTYKSKQTGNQRCSRVHVVYFRDF